MDLPPPSEPRQRWRITYAREPVAAEQVGRASLDAWQASLAASELPVASSDRADGAARIVFAAPLAANARGLRELVDVFLVERQPRWRVREAIAPILPVAHRWVAAEDVWLGAPSLVAQVVAADWRVELASPVDAASRESLRTSAAHLLAARELPRTRIKGGSERTYDLRPLLADVRIDPGPPAAVVMRTRFDAALGTGRPEEVIAELGTRAGIDLLPGAMTRTRLILVGDQDE